MIWTKKCILWFTVPFRNFKGNFDEVPCLPYPLNLEPVPCLLILYSTQTAAPSPHSHFCGFLSPACQFYSVSTHPVRIQTVELFALLCKSADSLLNKYWPVDITFFSTLEAFPVIQEFGGRTCLLKLTFSYTSNLRDSCKNRLTQTLFQDWKTMCLNPASVSKKFQGLTV